MSDLEEQLKATVVDAKAAMLTDSRRCLISLEDVVLQLVYFRRNIISSYKDQSLLCVARWYVLVGLVLGTIILTTVRIFFLLLLLL